MTEALPIAIWILYLVILGVAGRATMSSSHPELATELPLDWEKAAERLGFVQQGDKYTKKWKKGLGLELAGRSEGKRVGTRIRCIARFDAPLATDFRVVPFDGSRTSDVTVGRDFDVRYVVRTSQVERARELLHGAAARAVLAAGSAGWQVEVNELRVSVTGRFVTTEDEIARIEAASARIAGALARADERLPRLVPFAIVARIWANVARALGARFDRESRLLVHEGPHGRMNAHLRSQRDEQWYIELDYEFARPLEPAFGIADEGARELWEAAYPKDLVVGHAAFDEAFLVSTPDVPALAALIDGDVCDALLALEPLTSAVLVTETNITLRADAAAAEDDDLNGLLEQVLVVAEAFGRASFKASGRSYR